MAAVDDAAVTSVGILGEGRVGTALARLAHDAGLAVATAGSTGDPERVLGADVVILAIPLGRYRTLPAERLRGALVIDAMNYWWELDGARPELADPTTSTSETVQRVLGARVVKTLNHVSAWALENLARPSGAADRIAVGLAGDRPEDVARVAALLDRLGFEPVAVGDLAAGVALEPESDLFGADADAAELRRLVEAFPRSRRGRVVARARSGR